MRPKTGIDAVDAIIYAAHRVRTAADAALREHGLSLPGLKLLVALGDGDRSMREISQALHVSPRTITDMIDGLEARGLVARCPHPSDRRVTLLHLTEAGAGELAQASTASERVAAAAVGALDQDEQHTLRSLLERVCAPAAEPPPAPRTERAPAARTERAPAARIERAPAARIERTPAARTERATAGPLSSGQDAEGGPGITTHV